MIKAVIDANIFVSATLTEGTPPAQIIDAWQEDKFELTTSASIIIEIRRVIYYPKVRSRSPYSEAEITELLMLLERKSTRTPEKLKLEIVTADPTDDKYIIAAVEGKADYIVSGDPHLKDLKQYQGIKIIPPADFVTRLGVSAVSAEREDK
jgi:putative PIN family toxin of toxin-antitoxin system